MTDALRLLLAPMQDVTNIAFWHALVPRGGADIYITEYFRIHPNYRLEPYILESIHRHHTGRPVIAQLIGNDAALLKKASLELQETPITGIDINLGCPAPTVCGKHCGGALLKDPDRIRAIVETLRPVVRGSLTLKTRVGFDTPDEMDALLDHFRDLPIDALAIHGRTVKEKYQSPVHTAEIARAVQTLPYPVYANGSVVSVDSAMGMLKKTRPAGLMIGRGAIRNPWLFTQIRQVLAGEPPYAPTLDDLHAYVTHLFDEVGKTLPAYSEAGHVQRIKRFMNYIAVGVNQGDFLHAIRRAGTAADFHRICREHLQGPTPMSPEPEAEGKLFRGFRELAS